MRFSRDKFFAMAAITAAFPLFLNACGDDSSSNQEIIEIESSESQNSSDSNQDAGSATSSTQRNNEDKSSWNKDSVYTISGFVNRGQYPVGSEIVIRELDSSLAETGIVYKTTISSANGAYSVSDVKLTQPYLYLKVEGEPKTICYEGDLKLNLGNVPTYTYADIRKGSYISLNVLTLIQANKVPIYMNQGESFESAMEKSQKDLKDFFMMDTLNTDFNKTSLAEATENNFYLLAVTALSEMIYNIKALDDLAARDSLTDSDYDRFWDEAHSLYKDEDCFKFKANTKNYEYVSQTGTAKKYLQSLWIAKAGLGECSEKNYNEIANPSYSSTKWICDSTGWNVGSCYELDHIYLDTLTDTTGAKVIKSPYCNDNYYYYSSGWKAADNATRGLKKACIDETLNTLGSSGRLCYQCKKSSYGMSWNEVDASLCDIDQHQCTADGETFLGTVDNKSTYVCDEGKARKLSIRENILKEICITSSTEKSVTVDKTIFTCQEGEWTVTSIDSLEDSRDGKVYKTVGLGSQRWMTENLNYQDTTKSAILKNSIFTGIDNDDYDTARYGTLYNWNAAMNTTGSWADSALRKPVQGICPEGYHIPSSAEWDSLIVFVNKYRETSSEATSLKAISWEGWYPPDDKKLEGSDEFLFHLVASGLVGKDSRYVYSHKQAYLWTSDADTSGFSLQHLSLTESTMDRSIQNNKNIKAAIRCVED